MATEFELIKRYFTHPVDRVLLGVGDDAALVRASPGKVLAIAADMLVQGRHFFRDASAQSIGHKAVAVNLSDMAAMGAQPRWATMGIALPRADAQWVADFSKGFMRLARQFGVELIGGDTTRGPLNICVQIIGELPLRQALRRDGARVGDDIWVSGTLGDAALAVAARQGRIKLSAADLARAQRRLDQPQPRVALGLALRGVARSAIDVSDGLLADLGHICERSLLAAVVQWDQLPTSALLRRYHHHPAARTAQIAGGDDYELCFTAARSKRTALARIAVESRVELTRVGHMITAPSGIYHPVLVDRAGLPVPTKQQGFDHFD